MNGTADAFVTIVSGLPRSGTSLVMQMLKAGGMPVLSDSVRCADVDNPRGFLEFEAVKTTAADPSWLTQAERKAVKMAYPLLRVLPPRNAYRVIIPRRNILEVVASQNAMLKPLGKPAAGVPDGTLAAWLDARVASIEEWLASQPSFLLLTLPHRWLNDAPYRAAERLSEFCGGLDVAAMAAVVDPALYRQRAGSTIPTR